jgi:hypothetical protein
MGAVAKRPLDHSLPPAEVEERAVCAGMDELVPTALVTGPERPYGDRNL